MPRRRPAGVRVVLLTGSYDTAWRGVADAVRWYFAAQRPDVSVEEIDVLESAMPKAQVLSRLAYQGDAAFFPRGVMTLDEFTERRPDHVLATEACEGGLERLIGIVDARRPSAIIAVCGLPGLFAVAVGRRLCVPTVVCPCAWSVERLLVDPRADLVFVWSQRHAEELVVAGAAYDRVVVIGPPTSAVAEDGPVSAKPLVVCIGDGASNVAQQVVGSGARAVIAPGVGGEAPRDGDPRVEEAPSRTALLTLLAGATLAVAPAASPLVLEALSVAVPVIVYTRVPDEVSADVDTLVRAGAVLLSPDAEHASRTARYILESPWRREQMTDAVRRLVRPSGVRVLCERSLALVGS